MIADPCRACGGEGRALKTPQAERQHSRRGRRRHPHPRRRRGRGGRARRAAGRPLHLRPHEAARRSSARGHDAGRRCPVSFTTAALGGAITIPGIDGEKIEIKIPAGIQSGEKLRQRGAGMSVLNGRGRGDLVTQILVETPTKLSQGAEGDSRAVPRDRDRRRMPGEQGLLQPDSREAGRLGRPAAPRHARTQASPQTAAATARRSAPQRRGLR